MELYLVRIISLIAIALVYMLFDLFNKRNVPSIFVYGTLAYGALLTLLYFNESTILISGGIALVVLGIGYVLYAIGQLGMADVIEFAALSLILPLQSTTLLSVALPSFPFPFILSLIINTGIVAIIISPLLYIPLAKKRLKMPLSSLISKNDVYKAVMIAAIYAVFLAVIVIYIPISILGIVVFVLILVSSSILLLFSTPMAKSIVQYLTVNKLEEGDMIDLTLLGAEKTRSMKRKLKNFGGLVTTKLIKEMKQKRIKEKLPVYQQGIPFALFIFIGTILTILVGNILLLLFIIH